MKTRITGLVGVGAAGAAGCAAGRGWRLANSEAMRLAAVVRGLRVLEGAVVAVMVAEKVKGRWLANL
jgi:hypothetical protein